MTLKKWFKIYLWASVIALCAFLLFNLLQDIFGGEEAKVRKVIMRGKAVIEKKDILGLSDMVSLDYKDKYGNDRQALIYATKGFLSYYKDVFIQIESMDIKLDDSKKNADVEITAMVIGRTKDNKEDTILKGLEAEKDRFRVKLIKVDSKWKFAEVEFLQPVTIMGEKVALISPRGMYLSPGTHTLQVRLQVRAFL